MEENAHLFTSFILFLFVLSDFLYLWLAVLLQTYRFQRHYPKLWISNRARIVTTFGEDWRRGSSCTIPASVPSCSKKGKRMFRKKVGIYFAYLIWTPLPHNLSWIFATFWIQHRCCRESTDQMFTQISQLLISQPIAEQWKELPEIPWSVNSGSDRFVSFSSADSFALMPTATVTSKNDIVSCFFLTTQLGLSCFEHARWL